MDKYVQLAMVTETDYEGFKVNDADGQRLLSIFRNAQHQGEFAEAIKKKLFYFKDMKPDVAAALRSQVLKEQHRGDILDAQKEKRSIHALLGIVSETGEIAEEVVNALTGKAPLDVTNLKGELGDILWYIAILCNVHGWTMDEIQEANIAKLEARYGGKFDAFRANNRDAAAELDALRAKGSLEA